MCSSFAWAFWGRICLRPIWKLRKDQSISVKIKISEIRTSEGLHKCVEEDVSKNVSKADADSTASHNIDLGTKLVGGKDTVLGRGA